MHEPRRVAAAGAEHKDIASDTVSEPLAKKHRLWKK